MKPCTKKNRKEERDCLKQHWRGSLEELFPSTQLLCLDEFVMIFCVLTGQQQVLCILFCLLLKYKYFINLSKILCNMF